MFRSVFLMVCATVFAGFAVSHFLAGRVAGGNRPAVLDYRPAAPSIAQHSDDNRGYGEIAIAPDRAGNYETDVEIDGQSIHMMVDTGATFVSLTYDDASALGFHPAQTDYIYRTMTANGAGSAAKVRIDRLRIGTMEIDEVDAFVMPPGVLGTSLLGMSALRRLGRVEISGGELVLRQ